MEILLPKLKNFRPKMAFYSIKLIFSTNIPSTNKFNCDSFALYIILTLITTLFLALTQTMVRCQFTKEIKKEKSS